MDGNALADKLLKGGSGQAEPSRGNAIADKLLKGGGGREPVKDLSKIRDADLMAMTPEERQRLAQRARDEGLDLQPTDPVTGSVLSYVQGLTANTFDEGIARAGAGVHSLLTGADYERAKDGLLRQARKEVADTPPELRIPLEIAGNVTTGMMLPGTNLLRGGSAGVRTAKIAAAGGTGGAVDAFARGEGGLENRAEEAGVGFVSGAVTAPVLAQFVPFMAKTMYNGIRNGFGSLKNAEKHAYDMMIEALRKDGLSVQDAQQKLIQWRAEGGKPAALFDIGGENVLQVAKTFAKNPMGRAFARNTINTRNAAAAGRIVDDVSEAIGNGRPFKETRSAFVDARAGEARKLYGEAFDEGVNLSEPQEAMIARILETPTGKRAVSKARKAVEDDFAKFDDLSRLEQLHAIKLEMDDMLRVAGSKTNPSSQAKNDLRRKTALKKRFTELVGRGSEKYSRAMKQFGSESEVIDAMDLGQDVFKMRSDDIADAVRDMSADAKDAFAVGVTDAIIRRVEKAADGRNVLNTFFNSTEYRKAVRPAFQTDAAFSAFTRRMRREMTMRQRGDFVRGGSDTAANQLDQKTLDPPSPIRDVAEKAVNLERPIAGLREASGRMLQSGRENFRGRVAERGARGMFDTGNNNAMFDALIEAERRSTAQQRGLNPLMLGPIGPGADAFSYRDQ